jgi:hypothetical protein
MEPRPLPTQEYLHECFDYAPEAGELYWRHRPLSHFHNTRLRTAQSYQNAWNAQFATKKFGHEAPDGYVVGCLNNQSFQAARIIIRWMTGEAPRQVDHRDRDRANNRWLNLRAATVAQNKANSGVSPRNQCGWKGVNARRGRFCARMFRDGKYKHLGVFDTPEAAHAAYLAAARARWGEFAASE